MVERLEHIIEKEADRVEWEQLLQRSGIRQEPPYDAIYGIYGDGRLIATGAREGSRLKCIAIDNAYQGGTLFNVLLSRMIRDTSEASIERLFVYTKPAAAIAFESLGFRRIVDVPGVASFLERGTPNFDNILQKWLDETDAFLNQQSNCNGSVLNSQDIQRDVALPFSLSVHKSYNTARYKDPEDNTVESILMNANPFTLGHRALVENALTRAPIVHLFVLSEDVSLFPAHIRLRLVREGTSDLPGVIIHTTDAYMISRASFPSYFLKKKTDATSVQAELDATLFRDRIAPALAITNRTVGEEPADPVTAIYNETLISTLEGKINLTIVPRIKTHEGETISASRVRELFLEGDLAGLRPYVPETTYRYLVSCEGQAILKRHL